MATIVPSKVDGSAFTQESDRVVPAGLILDETGGTALSENDVAAARIDAKRAVVNVIEDETTRGRRMTVTAANAAKVDGSAVTQPVSAASLPLPTGAATLAEQQTQTTALQIIDDWDESDRAKVNPIAGQAGVQGGSGTVSANTQRVVLATDVTPPLPSGAATLAEQQTQTTSLQLIDDIVYTINGAINKSAAIAGQLDDTSTTVATENNVAPVRITSQRALHNNLRDTSGVALDQTTSSVSAVKVFVVGDDDKYVRGAQALNTAQVGGPVISGGIGSASGLTAVTDGFAQNLWLDLNGRMNITGTVDTELPAAAAAADGGSGTVSAPTVLSFAAIYNGSTRDRQRSVVNGQDTTGTGIAAAGILAQYDDTATSTVTENQFAPLRETSGRGLHTNARNEAGTELKMIEEVTVLTSASRTTTQTSADYENPNGCQILQVLLNVTSAGTGSITVTIDGKDNLSGTYYNLLTGAAVTTNSLTRYRVHAGMAAAANLVVRDLVPKTFRIVVTANNANAITYSVAYLLAR